MSDNVWFFLSPIGLIPCRQVAFWGPLRCRWTLQHPARAGLRAQPACRTMGLPGAQRGQQLAASFCVSSVTDLAAGWVGGWVGVLSTERGLGQPHRLPLPHLREPLLPLQRGCGDPGMVPGRQTAAPRWPGPGIWSQMLTDIPLPNISAGNWGQNTPLTWPIPLTAFLGIPQIFL